MSVPKVLVEDDIFDVMSNKQYGSIPYLHVDGNKDIMEFDFIIIKNRNGDELLKHFLSWEVNALSYTTPFYAQKINDISLHAVLTLLNNSIMWLRHCSNTNKLFWKNSFPIENIKVVSEFINNILKLLLGEFRIPEFIKIVIQYQKEAIVCDEYSIIEILEEFPWSFKITEIRLHKIMLLQHAILNIDKCIINKRMWKQIPEIAYQIHNEPYFIFLNSKEY